MNDKIILIIVGLLSGGLSGLIGVGGGIIMVPAMVYFLNYTQMQAQGTSLSVLMFPVGFLAVYNYYKAGNVQWNATLFIGLGFVLGAFLGSKLGLTIPEIYVKRSFAIFLLYTAYKMWFK
jgi:uncharacterized membrane protein YfcA